ncbi:MAG: hypothetical protein HY332_02715, partial [Chloroflexi bacterium]|nr:hypothetical protein [Chloroflexota bacterium]
LAVSPAFYQRIAFGGGLARTGLPLTGEESRDHLRVQLFERARLELDTTTGHIRFGDIGVEYLAAIAASFDPVENAGSSGSERYFDETGQYAQFGFLAYFDQIDGPSTLGPPLSPELVENERIVQYFAKGRLEWNAAAGRVEVGRLGEDLARIADKP